MFLSDGTGFPNYPNVEIPYDDSYSTVMYRLIYKAVGPLSRGWRWRLPSCPAMGKGNQQRAKDGWGHGEPEGEADTCAQIWTTSIRTDKRSRTFAPKHHRLTTIASVPDLRCVRMKGLAWAKKRPSQTHLTGGIQFWRVGEEGLNWSHYVAQAGSQLLIFRAQTCNPKICETKAGNSQFQAKLDYVYIRQDL